MLAAKERDIQLQTGLLGRLSDARARTDELFDLVRSEALYDRPIAERHRIVFYIGHLEAFDWNLLRERILDVPSFHPDFDHLFAFGIDPVDGGLPSDRPQDWPNIETVREYVSRVRSEIDDKLATGFSETSDADTLLNVAIEHRLMHAETLAYMLHQEFKRDIIAAVPRSGVTIPFETIKAWFDEHITDELRKQCAVDEGE